MIRISQLKLPVGHTTEALEKKICQQLKIKKEELSSWQIVHRSLDCLLYTSDAADDTCVV